MIVRIAICPLYVTIARIDSRLRLDDHGRGERAKDFSETDRKRKKRDGQDLLCTL
jgi:hypothetical protein